MERPPRVPKGFVKMTKTQLSSIAALANDVSAMIGGGDNDDDWLRYVKNIDRFLKANGIKRNFK